MWKINKTLYDLFEFPSKSLRDWQTSMSVSFVAQLESELDLEKLLIFRDFGNQLLKPEPLMIKVWIDFYMKGIDSSLHTKPNHFLFVAYLERCKIKLKICNSIFFCMWFCKKILNINKIGLLTYSLIIYFHCSEIKSCNFIRNI